MPTLDVPLLETTAEVSIALAGFTGIFLALGARDGEFKASDVVSIRSIVTCSVSPVFYAVLPILIASLGVREPEVWRVSSAVVMVVSIALWSTVMVSTRHLPADERVPDTRLVGNLGWLLGLLALVCHIVNILAWPIAPSAGLFLLGVWLVILVAAVIFVSLIFKRAL